MPQQLYPQERPSTHCMGGWVVPRVGTGADNIAPTKIRSPGHPDCRESLYQLHSDIFCNLPTCINFEHSNITNARFHNSMYLETDTQNFTYNRDIQNKHNKKLLKAWLTSAPATFMDNVIAT